MRTRARGFTLLELMVTVAVAGVLLSVAIPGFMSWVNNGKIRSVADQMQNGIRLAQTEALRRSHQVVFALTSISTPQVTSFSANTTGPYWAVKTIPFLEGETGEVVDAGSLVATNGRVTVSGPAQLCFNSVGRLTTNAATGISNASGTTCTASVQQYDINLTGGADTPLRIMVGLNGHVHMCNPNKTFDASNMPDGC